MIDVNRFCPGCMGEATGDRYCNICGYDSTSKNPVEALNVKFVLNNRYVIGKVCEQSSEGITYLAYDSKERVAVNIKEYFPLDISVRHPDKTVSVKSKDYGYFFNEGLLQFIDLNRKLATLDNISVFPIKNIFEDNGTAYVVMAQNTGVSLSAFLEKNGGILKWEQARPLFLTLLDTVITLNENGIIHGGISPETISVGRDGKLRLTNISIIETRFASEYFATAIYPGCAAIEQYSTEKGNIDSFTDVYGLASTLFRVLLGSLPPAANERLNNDKMSIPSDIASELPRQVLVALANGLQVKIGDRTKSVLKFRDEIVYGETSENIQKSEAKRKAAAQSAASAKAQKEAEVKVSSGEKKKSVKYAVISALSTAGVFILIAVLIIVLSPTVRNSLFPKIEEKKKQSSVIKEDTTNQVSPYDDAEPEKQYTVPDLKGKYYSQIGEDDAVDKFVVNIDDKAFSNSAPKGTIISQSLPEGSKAVAKSEIKVVISLGPKTVRIANVLKLEPNEAKIELLKQGFLYENIEVIEKLDPDEKPNTVIKQDPEYGKEVSPDSSVKIYVNPEQETDGDDEYDVYGF